MTETISTPETSLDQDLLDPDFMDEVELDEEESVAQYTIVSASYLRGPGLSLGAKVLLANLHIYQGTNSRAFPGTERLMKDLDCSRNSILRYRRELEDKGWIKTTHRRRADGTQKSNLYSLRKETPSQKWIEERKKSAVENLQGSKNELCKQGSKNELCSPIEQGSKFEPILLTVVNKNTTNHPTHKITSLVTGKKDEISSDSAEDQFERLWSLSKKKYGKKKARMVFLKLISEGYDPDVIEEAFKKYNLSFEEGNTNTRYYPQLYRWLDPDILYGWMDGWNRKKKELRKEAYLRLGSDIFSLGNYAATYDPRAKELLEGRDDVNYQEYLYQNMEAILDHYVAHMD
jgi:hypothetical protein